ncbi:MAG: hypothetical protein ACRCZK_00415 [Oscillospiraceae bacterium]
MNNPFNLDENQIESMLQKVSSQMGIDKDSLKSQLMSGNFDHLLENSNIKNKKMITKILSNPSLIQKFIEYQNQRNENNTKGDSNE